MCCGEIGVLGVQCVERARELLEGGLGIAKAEVARLLESRDRFGDARDGDFVGGDVEVGDSVPDELERGLLVVSVCGSGGGRGANC